MTAEGGSSEENKGNPDQKERIRQTDGGLYVLTEKSWEGMKRQLMSGEMTSGRRRLGIQVDWNSIPYKILGREDDK